MATKSKKAKTVFGRMTTSPLLHWITRMKGGKSETVHTKVLKVTAESIEEAAKISIATDLLRGTAPATLQKSFDSLCNSQLKKFNEENPDYVYYPGGRPKKSK
jgi:hypothetical protein